MEKKVLIFLLMLGLTGWGVVGCNSDKTKVEQKTKASYQCPMDCENGKTYNKAGKCPVCEMDLQEMSKG